MRSFIARLSADPAIRFALLMFAIFRLITLIIGTWAESVQPHPFSWDQQPIYNLHSQVFTSQGALRSALLPWYRWDTGWYLYIAHEGYDQNPDTIIFPPLYPVAIRAVSVLTGGDYLLAAVVISNLSLLIALTLLYKIIEVDYHAHTARWAIVVLLCYPVAFYLVAAYTETLFLMLILSAWWMVKRQHYVWAAVFAFFASLTRSQGWVLAIPFGYMVYVAPCGGSWIAAARYYVRYPLQGLRPLPAVLGGGLGTFAYLEGMRLMGYGAVEAQYNSAQWRTAIVMPWESILKAVRALSQGIENPYFANDLLNVLAFIMVIMVTLITIRRLKPEYTLFAAVTTGFILLRGNADIQLHGMLRYVLAIFPVFISWALIIERPKTRMVRLARTVFLAFSVGAQAVLLVLFVWWGWVA